MKSKKICLLILILTLIISIFPVVSNATTDATRTKNTDYSNAASSTPPAPFSGTGTINPDNYKPDNLQTSDVQGLGVYGGKIAGFIRIIGTIVSVGALMIIGIRFMLGSVEEKAEYKDRMYPYIIGAVLLFAASNFVDIIYGLAKNM